MGRDPDFFNDKELLNIYKGYLKYEAVLNELLPPWRLHGGSSYKMCHDNRDMVSQKLLGSFREASRMRMECPGMILKL